MFQGEYALDGGLHETTKDVCKDIQSQLDRISLYDSIREGIDEAYKGGREDFKYEVIYGLEKAIARTTDAGASKLLMLILNQIKDMDRD